MVNANGDDILKDGSNNIVPDYGREGAYAYKVNQFWGIIWPDGTKTPALLEAYKCGENQIIWAKYNGKWGILN